MGNKFSSGDTVYHKKYGVGIFLNNDDIVEQVNKNRNNPLSNLLSMLFETINGSEVFRDKTIQGMAFFAPTKKTHRNEFITDKNQHEFTIGRRILLERKRKKK